MAGAMDRRRFLAGSAIVGAGAVVPAAAAEASSGESARGVLVLVNGVGYDRAGPSEA